ncbi:MAG TPA: T9SS type A sorting domain-containing protein, partial [Gillisia sp.]|nr:T9SS type A sorting domain-containing protein [Gillisia sp.]
RYNKKGNKLQGHMNVIIRRLEADGVVHTYQVKGNAMQSLGVNASDENNMTAEFITKANMVDITDPLNPISLGGNLYLMVNMTDRGEPGTQDEIAISLTDSNNVLLYSSEWNGISTDQRLLNGGNLVVHSGFSLNKNTIATEDASITTFSEESDVAKPVLDMTIAPNPSSTYFSVRIHTENKKDNVLLIVHSYVGSILYETEGAHNKEFTFGSGFAAGTYIVKIYQANLSAQKIVIKE